MKFITVLCAPFAFHGCIALSYSWEGSDGRDQTITIEVTPPPKNPSK